MVDIVDKATRSRLMAGVGTRNTAPELAVRKYLHSVGVRYRLHDKQLPGRPDIVLPRFGAVIFVHGCFWHRHPGCRFATTPTSNVDFWQAKFQTNVKRDTAKAAALNAAGWRVHVVWECETRDEERVEALFWRVIAGAD